MDERSLSRRTALRSAAGAVGLLALSSTAGCLDGLPFVGDTNGDGREPVDLGPIPKDVDLLCRADGDALLADEGLRQVVTDGVAARTDDGRLGPGNTDELIASIDAVYGLDPTAVSTAVGFSTIATADPLDSMAGAVVTADWDPEAIPTGLREAGFSTTEGARRGMTVYDVRNEISQVGVLGDDRFVVGTEGAVAGAIDIEAGEADAIDDDLRSAFHGTSRGPGRFAARFPPLVDGVAALLPNTGELVRDSLLNKLTFLAGSVQVEGDERLLQSRVSTDSKSDAERFQSVVEGGLALGTALAPNDGPIPTALDEVAVEVLGSQVTVSYRATVDQLETLAPAVVQWLIGTGTVGPIPADWDGSDTR